MENELWKTRFEIRPDYIAEGAGDIDIYIIFDKLTNSFVKASETVTWWAYLEEDAIRMAIIKYEFEIEQFEEIVLALQES